MSDVSNHQLEQNRATVAVSAFMARARKKLATRKKIKKSAVAGFLLMPQFRLSMRGFGHIYPIFIRTLAGILIQAGLVPENHPAQFYGEAGVSKQGFRSLMGLAWFNLRTKHCSPFQWSMFGGVVLMAITMVAAVGSFLGRVFLGIGEVAQAQIFTAISNPNDPYGAGVGVTAIEGGTSTISGAAGLFDLRVENNNISADYALMILDKILRQAAANTPNGGALQNALGGLMEIYNTGVLLVACLVIGWMVTSVIIDTAKTGTLGGGRHNMAWTPIRVVFAIAIMFPLGSAGFSSGQYMVMKLAEYGSNFGARGWTAYVTGVIANQTLLAPFAANNATTLVSGISKVMVCQVAFNTYVMQSTGALDPDYVIERQQTATATSPDVINTYSNKASANLCGTIRYTVNTTTDDDKAVLAYDDTTPVTAMSASTPMSAPDNVYKNAGLSTAVTTFRDVMRGAVSSTLTDTQPGLATDGGAVISAARKFACDFVARRYNDGANNTGTNPVSQIPNCDAATKAAATDPDLSAQQGMLSGLIGAIQGAYASGGQGALAGYVTGSMVTEMTKRGWAGMGMWYQDIANLNSVLAQAREPTATVEPGTAWSTGVGGGGFVACSGTDSAGEPCKMSGLEEKVMTIMGDYDRWWEATVVPGVAGKVEKPGTNMNEDVNPSPTGITSLIKSMASSAGGDNNIIYLIGRLIFPRSTDTFMFKAVDLAATGTYPLAQISDTGHSVLGVGLGIWGAVALLQTLSTIEGLGFSAGEGFALSSFVNAISSIGTMMVMSGIMIAFYLPILPFLRVAFSVLNWAITVFEAVVMLPIAALAHLDTTGKGFVPHGAARNAWIMWLHILLRPMLVVIGFVAGMIIFNTFAVFFHTCFSQGATAVMSSHNYVYAVIAKLAFSVIYLSTLYTAANTCFKIMDMFPDAMMKWMGGGVQRDVSADQNVHHDNMVNAATFRATQIAGQFQRGIASFNPRIIDPNEENLTNKNAVVTRAQRMMRTAGELTDSTSKSAQADRELTMKRMSQAERDKMATLSARDAKRFLAHKFMEQENKRFIRPGQIRGFGHSLTQSSGIRGLRDREEGQGLRWHKKDTEFVALDDPNLAAGSMAGIAVGDKLLENTLAAKGNRTHTSNMDMMSEAQRDAVRRNIEAQMSGADALAYMSLSDDERQEFIESYYATDPTAFAPGIGTAGMGRVFNYMTNDTQNDLTREDRDEYVKLTSMMTRDEKADLAQRYIGWANRRDKTTPGTDPNLLTGQMAAAAVTDKGLQDALDSAANPKPVDDRDK